MVPDPGRAVPPAPADVRIFYNKKFFHYPLKPFEALVKLGPVEGVRIVLSYLRWRLFPYRDVDTFEQWVTNRFGQRLFRIFFKSYTEKVWGIPCTELKAEWAAQRIKNLTLGSALLNWLFKPKRRDHQPDRAVRLSRAWVRA